MKKLLLILIVLGVLTSCKKKEEVRFTYTWEVITAEGTVESVKAEDAMTSFTGGDVYFHVNNETVAIYRGFKSFKKISP